MVAFSLLCVLVPPGWSRADTQPVPIAMVRTAGDERLSDRLHKELATLGWPVTDVEGALGETEDRIARRVGAVAVLRPHGTTVVEVWILDPETGGAAFKEVVTVSSEGQIDVLAVRVVEISRAQLVRVGIVTVEPEESTSQPPASQPPPSQPPSAPLRGERRWLWVGVGPHGAYSLGGLDHTLGAQLEIRIEPTDRWSASALLAASAHRATISGSEGSADVGWALLGALGGYTLALGSRGRFGLAGGVGALRVSMQGEAESPYRGVQDSVWSAVMLARVGCSLGLAPAARLRADLLGGYSLPTPTIRFADRTVAHWGSPMLMGAVTIEAGMARGSAR
jgi:hypothetical protein